MPAIRPLFTLLPLVALMLAAAPEVQAQYYSPFFGSVFGQSYGYSGYGGQGYIGQGGMGGPGIYRSRTVVRPNYTRSVNVVRMFPQRGYRTGYRPVGGFNPYFGYASMGPSYGWGYGDSYYDNSYSVGYGPYDQGYGFSDGCCGTPCGGCQNGCSNCSSGNCAGGNCGDCNSSNYSPNSTEPVADPVGGTERTIKSRPPGDVFDGVDRNNNTPANPGTGTSNPGPDGLPAFTTPRELPAWTPGAGTGTPGGTDAAPYNPPVNGGTTPPRSSIPMTPPAGGTTPGTSVPGTRPVDPTFELPGEGLLRLTPEPVELVPTTIVTYRPQYERTVVHARFRPTDIARVPVTPADVKSVRRDIPSAVAVNK